MYICKECGEVFPEPNIKTEYHPAGDGFVREDFGYCPSCGSSGWEEARYCNLCGEVVPDSDYGFHICGKCERDALDKLRDFVAGLTREERAYLSWKIEGEELEAVL